MPCTSSPPEHGNKGQRTRAASRRELFTSSADRVRTSDAVPGRPVGGFDSIQLTQISWYTLWRSRQYLRVGDFVFRVCRQTIRCVWPRRNTRATGGLAQVIKQTEATQRTPPVITTRCDAFPYFPQTPRSNRSTVQPCFRTSSTARSRCTS